MKKGRPRTTLTPKEEQIMNMLWTKGPLYVREMVELYPDPRPHFNTVSTTVRILQQKGYVGHNEISGSHQYYAIAQAEDLRSKSLGHIISTYFHNSYLSAVSSLVEEEKISVDELRELIDMVERKNDTGGSGEQK